jgi:hypothetical protein
MERLLAVEQIRASRRQLGVVHERARLDVLVAQHVDDLLLQVGNNAVLTGIGDSPSAHVEKRRWASGATP